MFGFHKPKMYRSLLGCCICRAKSSSSRFTDSQRYERDFRSCFGLGEARSGEICNACVLLVKRWKKLPVGSKKNWNHVVDARGGPSVKTAARPRKMKLLSGRVRPGPGPVSRLQGRLKRHRKTPRREPHAGAHEASSPMPYLTRPVSCLLSPVSCLLSPVSCLLSPVSCLLSPVSCLLSPVSCLLSPVSCRLRRAQLRLQRLARPVSQLQPPVRRGLGLGAARGRRPRPRLLLPRPDLLEEAKSVLWDHLQRPLRRSPDRPPSLQTLLWQ
ncbi:SIN3-HDAC complex-associated factor isoform X1 [Lepisosteus oculatus]|uniref:SIN3-HDAC complex-associated factor isoform X1 n=1 Tax=Lepisosteus oculatus TaxID=7918 RepID=UPI0037248BF7